MRACIRLNKIHSHYLTGIVDRLAVLHHVVHDVGRLLRHFVLVDVAFTTRQLEDQLYGALLRYAFMSSSCLLPVRQHEQTEMHALAHDPCVVY